MAVKEALPDLRAEPLRRVRAERAMAYPPIGDPLDALMKDAQRRRAAGNPLVPELAALLDQVLEVKQRRPKEDLGLL